MDKEQELWKVFSVRLRRILTAMNIEFERLQEIRLRVWEPLLVIYDSREFFVGENGRLNTCMNDVYVVTPEDIQNTVDFLSRYSLYAYEDEIRQGFLTIQGGHRVGIAGKVIMDQNGIKTIRHISFLNIRLSHQVKGCGASLLSYIEDENGVKHTLIISPPRCGKTTLLRDLIRLLSDGTEERAGVTVGVVDPQNDLGKRTDILDCCPKAYGMLMLIRSMSPVVVAVDEIGSREDIEAIEYVMNAGCTILATVHGNSIEDIRNKPVLRRLVEERIFERYVVLNNKGEIGHIERIFDAQGNSL